MERPKVFDYQKGLGSKKQLGIIKLTNKDVSLYAVGIGFNQDPLREQDYKYTNEKLSAFTTFPTITAAIKLKDNIHYFRDHPSVPAFQIHQILHAQEKLYMVQNKIKIGVQYRTEAELIDAADKGKNGFFYIRTNAYNLNEQGVEQLAFYVDRCIFVRGLGGFGFKGNGKTASIPQPPKRNPDYILKDGIFLSQAFIYRLSDDDNTLHIDPNVSKKAGFDKPIIHGMASYGVVARSIVQNILGNNPQALKSYEIRLVGHVFPGQNFEIRVWKEGLKLHVQVIVVERKSKALVGVLTIRESAKI